MRGAFPCLNTVAQLPYYLRTQSCHYRHVSIPVLPQAGKSPTVYFGTSLSAVLWNAGHWKSGKIWGVLTRAGIMGWGQPSTSIRVQVWVRIR